MAQESKDDPRLLTAQLAIEKLRDSLFSKSSVRPGLNKDRTNEILVKMDSTLMSLKFSYLPPAEMARSQMVTDIFELAKELYIGYKEALDSGFQGLPRANILWAFGVLSGLQRRLKNSGEKSTHGIDIVAVTIRNISQSGELYTTNCIAGPRQMTIVTNIPDLKAGDTLRAALLPPAIVGGTVSEAMFLGSELISDEAGSFIKADEINTKEADSILFNELRKL